jgi:predicted nucleotide-binding protein
VFTDDRAKKEYSYRGAMFFGGNQSLAAEIKDFRGDVTRSLRRLESIIERLDLFDEPEPDSSARTGATSPGATATAAANTKPRVFLVHGHDAAIKHEVARFLERQNVDVVILHEQANIGRTLMEKLEAYAGVAFAVVLLTPDDVGAAKAPKKPGALRPRARQNVVFELGYFFGRLGRQRVAAIFAGEIDKPTDIDGLVYIDGQTAAWKFDLSRELRAAGIDVDLNLAN